MSQQVQEKKVLKVNPAVFDEIKSMGAFDVTACMNCGMCTVSCPLSVAGNEFPRKIIRYGVFGIKNELLAMPEPWLCYYCGECSETCPAQADPAGYMMAVRRYAITEYSLAKIGKLFYDKVLAAITYLLLTIFAFLGIWYFSSVYPHPEGEIWLTNGWEYSSYKFIPYDVMHYAGMILGVLVISVALIQGWNMLKHLMKRSRTPSDMPFSKKFNAIVKSFIAMFVNEGLVEKRYQSCDRKWRYLAHLAIFWGYVILFIATAVISMADLLIETPELGLATIIDRAVFKTLAKVFGLIGAVLLMYGASYFIYKRLIKNEPYGEKTHFSDFMFLGLSFLIGLSGLFIDLFWFIAILGNVSIIFWAYIFYGIHLYLVFLLLVTAPFTKFAHMEYRLLAVWYTEYQNIVSPPETY